MYNELSKWFNKNKKMSKAHGKLKSNFYSIKNQGKLTENRQTPAKHNNLVTCGDISIIKADERHPQTRC